MAYPWNLIVKGRDIMLKKLKSRRGFTIVEVMVAFVIFAIMAGMVTMILNQAIMQKRHNKEVDAQLQQQEAKYYLNTQDYKYNTADGKIQLNFTGGTAVDINYEYGDPNGDDEDVELRLKYLIGQYGLLTKGSTGGGGDDDAGGSSVMSRLDSRIYGTAKIDSVNVKVQDKGTADGGYLYVFSVLATAPDLVGTQYEYHAQVKMMFPSTVVDYGYVGVGDLLEAKNKGATKEYKITLPTPTTVCVGSNMPRGWYDYNSSKRKSFVGNTSYVKFWVILPEEIDADNLNNVFGTSGTNQTSNKVGDSYEFTPYLEVVKSDDGKEMTTTHVNIFGAFPLSETPDPGTTE